MKTRKLPLFGIICLVIACTHDDPSPFSHKEDYFPLKEGNTWQYTVAQTCDCSCPCASFNFGLIWFQHQFSLKTAGDSVINDRLYRKIEYESGDIAKMVRRDDSRYYARNTWKEEEHLFLDTSLPVGSSWVGYQNEYYRLTYTIKLKNDSRVIGGKSYKNIIVVEEAYCWTVGDECDPNSSQIVDHYFAPGAGEVYSHRPYNPLTYYSGNENMYLVKGP